MILRALSVILALALTLAGAAPAAAGEGLLVFAAASLKTALDRVAADWQAGGGGPVTLSYAGTPALAQQILAGAPADLFIAASPDWMDELERQGRLRDGTRRDLLGNRLVLVRHGPGPEGAEIGPGFDLPGLLGNERLAMAMVTSVPAGIYGREALTTLGLWDAVEAQIAQTDNVRAALALVASGEAPLGVVYRSDAIAEPRVSVAGIFPDTSHRPILYPAAVLAASGAAEAGAFLDYLASDAARAVFDAEGFTLPGAK